MKLLILFGYYNRPLLVRKALESVAEAAKQHDDWELLFGDDNSDVPGRPIAEEILKDHLSKVTFLNSNNTLEDKLKNGLNIGYYCNETIKSSSADIAIMLCDDDQLHPDYLRNISTYFESHESVLYCWSYIYLFNPMMQAKDGVVSLDNKYNKHDDVICPVNKVDASQVAWRLDCCKKYGAWFSESTKIVSGKPWIKDTDKSFFENLYEKCGPCHKTGFVSQYKGVHDYQLLWNKNAGIDGLRSYMNELSKKAGALF